MTMTMSKPFCFGMPSAFCAHSETCKECEHIRECIQEVYKALRIASGIEPSLLKRMLTNHIKLMKMAEIPEPIDYESAKTLAKPEEILENFMLELSAKKILREGFIADDLTGAPDYFKQIVEIIKLRGSTTQTSVVTHIKAVLPDLNDPIAHTALALQALAKAKVIQTTKRKIKWVGNGID